MTADAPAPKSSLIPRVVASAVLIPLTLAVAYVGGWVLAAWVALGGIAMSLEWTQIVHKERFGWRFTLHALALGISLALASLDRADLGWTAILVCAIIGAAMAQQRDERSVWVILGVLYIAVPCLAFVWLRTIMPLGFETILWLLAVVWSTDSIAYLIGSMTGGPKLAPSISPRKTWAGAVAGLAGAAIASGIFALACDSPQFWTVVAFGVALSLFTQMGDLAESSLKRTFGVKDMSDLIPGHGGALDRLDGLIFATLAMSAGVLITGLSPLAWSLG